MRTLILRPSAAACLLLAASFAGDAPAAAQVASSRLGLAKATGIVAPGHVQLETGYTHGEADGRTRDLFGETLVRIGVVPRTEIRAGFASYQRTLTPARTVEGAGDASVSLKHRMGTAAGWMPAVALTAGTTLPTGARAVSAGAAQPEGSVSAEWALPGGARALGAVGHRSAVAADDRFGSTTVAVGGRLPLGPRAVGQLDYARTRTTRAGSVDAGQLRLGAALRLTRTLQLDAFVGRAEVPGGHETLVGVGFARLW